MAYISFQPKDYYSTKLFTGNGSTQTISGVGFQPDLTWFKQRDGAAYHQLSDVTRGVNSQAAANDTGLGASPTCLTAWNSDGFALGSNPDVNGNTLTYTSMNWKAGTTSGLTGGTITPSSYSFNTTSGFSVLKWTGTGSNGTIAHMLGVTPQMIIVKQSSGAEVWCVYTEATGNGNSLVLNTSAASAAATAWNSTSPTSSVFSVGTDGKVNGSGQTYFAYCFSSVKGYSKIAKYTGNGNADGTFVYTGFRPAFIMIKRTNSASAWVLFDSKRNGYNGDNKYLVPNTTAGGGVGTYFDIFSNGFKPLTTDGEWNAGNYTYLAIAENPIVSSNDVPGLAR
jgi:hypothetical protein